MRNRLTTLLCLVLVLSFPVLLKAQEVASHAGVVTDTSRQCFPMWHTLINTKTNVSYNATTNITGRTDL